MYATHIHTRWWQSTNKVCFTAQCAPQEHSTNTAHMLLVNRPTHTHCTTFPAPLARTVLCSCYCTKSCKSDIKTNSITPARQPAGSLLYDTLSGKVVTGVWASRRLPDNVCDSLPFPTLNAPTEEIGEPIPLPPATLEPQIENPVCESSSDEYPTLTPELWPE